MDQQLLDLADPPTNLSTNPPPTNSSTSRQTLAASLYLAGASLEDIIQALEDKQPIDPRALLPRHFHQFLPAFDVAAANTLPPTVSATIVLNSNQALYHPLAHCTTCR
jgi:hypothetical protein